MSIAQKVILFIALTLAVAIVSTCAKREPVEEGRCRLKFKAVAEHDEAILALATQNLSSSTDKPSELTDLPKDLIADYVYFLAELAGKNTPMILGSYSKLEHSMLYVDMNGDGRLSDEKPYRPKITEIPETNGKEYKFGPIVMRYLDAEREFETKFYAKTYSGRQLVLHPSGYRVGKLRLDKNTYEVAVVDGNLDGRYDGILSLPFEDSYKPGCDIFAIDLSRDGKKWLYSSFWSSEIMPLARMVRVYNTYYGIDITPDGTTLELKKVQPKLGTLDFGGANVKLKLWSDAADQFLFGSEGSWSLPAGAYSALFLELNEIDSSRIAWTFKSYRDTGPLRDFEIRVGETTSFKIGPPFSVKTDVKQIRDRVLIGMKLEGRAKERYRLPVMKGGRRLPAPEFKIVNESGKVLASGQFEYG